MRRTALAIVSSLFLMCILPLKTQALKVTSTGLVVSPAIEQIAMAEGQTQYNFSYLLTNDTGSSLDITLSTQNFTSLNNNGSVYILPAGTGNSHGLAGIISFGIPQLVIAPGKSSSVPIVMKGLNHLTPGGYYGAVEFSVASANSQTTGNNISVREKLNALIFLTTPGRINSSLRLQPLKQGPSLSLPTYINLVFNNDGSEQNAPHGIVTLKKGNREIARGIININSALILPGTSRLFSVSLYKDAGGINYPGVYTIDISYSPGERSTNSTYSKSFLFINQGLLISFYGLLIVVAVIMLIRSKRHAKYVRRR